jgi:hypothetical protein
MKLKQGDGSGTLKKGNDLRQKPGSHYRAAIGEDMTMDISARVPDSE